jgi:cytochrome b6-f complex iron-sulfur subunit
MNPTRREFVKAGAAAVVACAGCSMLARKREPDLTLKLVDGEIRIPNATLQESLVLEIPDVQRVLLFRVSDGSVHAVSITCTHLGCDVEYARDRGRIECPCHGSEYDVEGRNLRGPAKKPLTRYAASREGNEIVVRIVAT